MPQPIEDMKDKNDPIFQMSIIFSLDQLFEPFESGW
jgi:hypothetical protein